jgi:hypothetical protein
MGEAPQKRSKRVTYRSASIHLSILRLPIHEREGSRRVGKIACDGLIDVSEVPERFCPRCRLLRFMTAWAKARDTFAQPEFSHSAFAHPTEALRSDLPQSRLSKRRDSCLEVL